MILDGYTELFDVGGRDVLLRPFTRFDRPLIAKFLDRLPDDFAFRCEQRLVFSRVADCDGDVSDLDYERLSALALGIGRTEEEKSDEKNLHRGVYLFSRYPWMERTTCEQCRSYFWDPITGQTQKGYDQQPLPRRKQSALLCELASDEYGTGTACPRRHWQNPVGLSDKNAMAWSHYQACEAAGAFPDDPVVKRNARVIRHAIELARSDKAADGRAGTRGRASRQLRHTVHAGRADD